MKTAPAGCGEILGPVTAGHFDISIEVTQADNFQFSDNFQLLIEKSLNCLLYVNERRHFMQFCGVFVSFVEIFDLNDERLR